MCTAVSRIMRSCFKDFDRDVELLLEKLLQQSTKLLLLVCSTTTHQIKEEVMLAWWRIIIDNVRVYHGKPLSDFVVYYLECENSLQ